MNKLTVSLAIALALCSFTPADRLIIGGACAGKECIFSFLTVPSSSKNDKTVIEQEEVEYGFKLYELIKGLFE